MKDSCFCIWTARELGCTGMRGTKQSIDGLIEKGGCKAYAQYGASQSCSGSYSRLVGTVEKKIRSLVSHHLKDIGVGIG